jgi:hypothetical protein
MKLCFPSCIAYSENVTFKSKSLRSVRIVTLGTGYLRNITYSQLTFLNQG